MMRRADILSFIADREDDLRQAEFLPADFWEEAYDVLLLCDIISAGWAEATEAGQKAIDIVYDTMCSVRDVAPEQEFETIEDFLLAQEVDEDDYI
jgi:hypothetical protein